MTEQIDEDKVLEEMREQYREETGEELPDHVLENYDEFFSLGPTVDDLHDAMETARKNAPEEYTGRDVALYVSASIVVTAATSFAVAFAVASSFGMAVAALVCVGIGFVFGSFLG